jgi:acyl-CoA reductase-like NAD-dependent aldehyde dehydrogenase
MQAGMTSINDFATTYMCQSLPFGGVKHSGFDRFAGIEGLRGLTVPKAVAEDRCTLPHLPGTLIDVFIVGWQIRK